MGSVKANVEMLESAKKSAASVAYSFTKANKQAASFEMAVIDAADTFTSEKYIKMHYKDFLGDEENYRKTLKDPSGKAILDDNGNKITWVDEKKRESDAKEAAKVWLNERAQIVRSAATAFSGHFRDETQKIIDIDRAITGIWNAIIEFEGNTYSLADAVKKLDPKGYADSYKFDTNREFSDELGINVDKLLFMNTEGGSSSVDEAFTAGMSGVDFQTKLLEWFGKVSLDESGATTLDPESRSLATWATGVFTLNAFKMKFFNSLKTVAEMWTAAVPGGKYDADAVKEANRRHGAEVLGLPPGAIDGLGREGDTGADYVGPIIPALTVLAGLGAGNTPATDSAADKLLKAAGSDKNIEQVRQDHTEYVEQRQAEREAETLELDDDGLEVTQPEKPTVVKTTTTTTPSKPTSPTQSDPTPISDTPIDHSPTSSIVDPGGRVNPPVKTPIKDVPKPDTTPTSVDNQALNEYYGKGLESIEADRSELLTKFENAYNGVDVEEFKTALSKGGYSPEDINYIMDHKEIGFTALVTATQASTLTEISSTLASQQGIVGFDTSYNDGLKLDDLLNGKAQAKLGVEMDSDVASARTKMSSMRSNYNSYVDKANASVKQANDDKAALDKVRERIIKKSGTDTSNWSDEDVKEYNEAVTKYNNSNAQANEDVETANKLKGELDKFENEFEELKDKKYEELLRDYQSTIDQPTTDQPTSSEIERSEPGAEIPGDEYSGDDSTILATVTGGEDGLTVGDGEQALGATVVTPESTSSGDDAILSGLNLGDGGLSIGAPDSGTTVGIEPPASPQPGPDPQPGPAPQPSQNVDVQGVNNVQVNETAFTDERVLPDLGLSIDMNTITGGNKGPIGGRLPIGGNLPIGEIRSFESPVVDTSDAEIIGGLNITEDGISSSTGYEESNFVPIDTPAINAMASPEFENQIRKELTTDDIGTAVRESSNSQKIDTSRFVEPPSSTQEVQGVTKEPSTKTELENGIVIELGEDGSLRL